MVFSIKLPGALTFGLVPAVPYPAEYKPLATL